jgi:phosphoribosyl 1,2-cyclic phosphate phosphodiesterase
VNGLNIPTVYFTHISHQLGLHQTIEAELPQNIHLAYDGLAMDMKM